MERTGNYTDHKPVILTRLYRSDSGVKVADAANGEGEPRDKVCETADASASFTSEAWKYFDFIVSRNEKTIFKQCRTISKTHLQHYNKL